MRYIVQFRFKLMFIWSSYAMIMKGTPWNIIQDGRQYINSLQNRVHQFNHNFYLNSCTMWTNQPFQIQKWCFLRRLCNKDKIKASKGNPRWPTKCSVFMLCTRFKTFVLMSTFDKNPILFAILRKTQS